MAKDQVPYIKHDVNASSDIKCKALRQKYGWEGQGWYWDIVEKLRAEQTTFSLEYGDLTFSSLAEDYKCEPAKVKQYIDDCINLFHLFTKTSDNKFHSLRLDRDMDTLNYLRELNSKKGKMSGIKRRPLMNSGSAVVQPLINKGFADVELAEDSIVKYSIDKDRIDDDNNPFTLYQKNIGQLTNIIAENIKDAEKEYTIEWVCDAIKRAVKLEKRSWSYVEGVLRGWKREGKNDGRNSAQNIQQTVKYTEVDLKSPEYLAYKAKFAK